MISGGQRIDNWVLDDAAHNIWRADVGALETRQLYVDGVRARRAVLRPGVPGKNERNDAGLATDSTDPRNWDSPRDVEFVWNGHQAGIFAWAEARCRVKEIKPTASGTQIDMVQPCFGNAVGIYGAKIVGGGHSLGMPTWAENSVSFLKATDQEGRWVIRRSGDGNRIYYRPGAGKEPKALEVVAAVSEQLIRITGIASPARNIVLRGIEFTESTWLGPDSDNGFPVIFANLYTSNGGVERTDSKYAPSAVELSNVENIQVENSHFTRLGSNALGTVGTAKNVTVIGNRFDDLSGGAIVLVTITFTSREIVAVDALATAYVGG